MIPIAEPSLGEEELRNVVEAVKTNWISSKGKFIPEFEKSFANYCDVKYGIATSNGTTALHLALAALGIRSGNEVLVPSLTFISTANVVGFCGATPIFVDSHPDYWCTDPSKLEENITEKTKAIMPVHLYGHPCDMDPIFEIAKEHNLFVIEDAAEAHGAEYKGKKIGGFGDVSCFSFYGNKIITTGEGGMCVTDNEELAEKMKVLRDHGEDPKKRYWHKWVGFNYRMTNLQAAVGVAQVKRLEEFIQKKRKIVEWYNDALRPLSEKGLIRLHPEMPWAKSTYWMYSILVENDFPISRDELIKKLEENGIETRPFFPPIQAQQPYISHTEKTPIAVELSLKGINLPSSVNLTKQDIEFITKKIKE